MITDGHNDHLDGGDNDSDGHDSLRSLFSPAELDRDSTDTDLSLDPEPKRLHKRLADDAVPAAERLRIGDSAGKNSISFNFSSGKFLRAADMPIVLECNGSAVDLNDLATLDDLRREQEPHWGFDERIPLSLSTDAANTNNQHNGGIDKTVISQGPSSTMRRGSSPLASHSTKDPAEMPPKDEMATRGRGSSGRTGPNECGDDFEDDVSDDAKRFRFTKQPKVSTWVHENATPKRSISNRASTTSRNETGAFSADN
jgi:hypothetical protein